MKRFFQRFRDDRFALTTLQNPNVEVRTHAELVQAAQQVRENQPGAAQIAPTQTQAAPNAPDSIPNSELPVIEVSTAPDPDPTALAPLDSADPDSTSPDSVNRDSTDDDVQQIVDSIIADALASGGSLPSSRDCPRTTTNSPRPPPQNRVANQNPNHAANPIVAQPCPPWRALLLALRVREGPLRLPQPHPKIKISRQTTPAPPRSSATPANAPSATILTANISKKPSCNGAVPIPSNAAGSSSPAPQFITTPTPSISSLCALAISTSPSAISSRVLMTKASPPATSSTPSASWPTSTKTAAGPTPPTNPKSPIPCSACLSWQACPPEWDAPLSRAPCPPQKACPRTQTQSQS